MRISSLLLAIDGSSSVLAEILRLWRSRRRKLGSLASFEGRTRETSIKGSCCPKKARSQLPPGRWVGPPCDRVAPDFSQGAPPGGLANRIGARRASSGRSWSASLDSGGT
jgi:xanthine/CO dehydrogenase XdhC/CoxF family maturation factor